MKKDLEVDKSFDRFKKTYDKISKNKSFLKNEKILCPVCGKYRFVFYYDVCSFCGWEHDWMQLSNPKVANYANILSLEAYRNWYEMKIKIDSKFNWIKTKFPKGQPIRKDLTLLRKELLKKNKYAKKQ